MERLIDEFFKLPWWAQLLTALIIISMLKGVHLAWGEHRFVAGFAEATIATILYWGGMFGSFGLAIYSGMKLTNRTKSTVLGWVIGIIVFIFIGATFGTIVQEIPGVGWRFELMMSHD